MLLKELLEKLSPAIKAKVGDKVMGDPDGYGMTDQKLRIIAKLQGLSATKLDEPNTKWEDDLITKLNTWVGESDNVIANYFKKNKDIFKQLAKEYPKLFQAPIGESVYRGTKVSRATVINILSKQSKMKVITVGSKRLVVIGNVLYTPKRESQSWSFSPKTALSFMKSGFYGSDKFPVMLSGKSTSDFILSPELMAAFYGENEEEIVRVAKQGKFTVMLNADDLVEEFVLHHTKAAQPAFQSMVDEYNRFVTMVNKTIQQRAKGLDPKKKSSLLRQTVYVMPPNYDINNFDFWDGVPFNKAKDKFPIPLAKTVNDITGKRAVLQFEDKFFKIEKEYYTASRKFLASLGK
jgi:hypothetical protein